MKSGRNWGRLGMKSNWKTCQLDELVTFTSGGTPSKKKAEYWNGSIPWISAKTMKDEHISTSDLMISEEGLKNGSRLAPQGSILFLIRGSGLFNGIPICLVDKPVAFNQDVKCINSISEIENKYVFYWLLSQASTLSAIVGVTTIGAGKFDMDVIKRLEISYPEKEVRNEIIRIADAISDKIRLNTAINENLESQAQAIYQSMFISTHHETDRMGLLSELITVKYGKDHKKLNDGIYPVYGSGGIMRYVEKPIYEKESVLIPRKGSLNNVMYVDEPFWSVDTMFYTEMKMPNAAKYVFHFVKSKDLASLNAGSAVPSMTTDILNSMEVRIPSMERLAEFEELVAPLYRTIKGNICQSASLASLRDTLLPKLMNGEIDVSEVKI